MKGGGIFGGCKWQEEYPPIPPLPSIESFSSKVKSANKVKGNSPSEDYLRGFKDGDELVYKTLRGRCSDCDNATNKQYKIHLRQISNIYDVFDCYTGLVIDKTFFLTREEAEKALNDLVSR